MIIPLNTILSRDSHDGMDLNSYRMRFGIPAHQRQLNSTSVQQPLVTPRTEPSIATTKQIVPASKRKRRTSSGSDICKRPRYHQDDLAYIERENEALKGHWYTGLEVNCNMCKAVFYDEYWLRRHLAVSHGKIKKKVSLAQKETYACLVPACKKMIIHQKSSIGEHLDDDHKLPLEDYAKSYGLEVS